MNKKGNEGFGNEVQNAGSRRRGDILENAILQSAWDELNEVGYSRLSMEGVAARAKTNKNAVYRRWPGKAKLVIAAILKHVPKPSMEAPDTGNLRIDVLTLLLSIAKPLQMIGAETIHGIMVDYHGKDLISSLPQFMHRGTEDKLTIIMRTILKNAEMRGEINRTPSKSRVMSLPFDLIRYELLTTHEMLSDNAITQIVDDVFLPLVLFNR
ncbi:TetR/AcrR family transcriptional regulator [Paenibacillus sp. WQ 127069]|uniref:TetR/AcrR family transcriptional regulator n=1 Tax=Paenibacillus baimaensis TaxID=2982185 RepID=A0ABT2UBC8_9BACL|nr:TetR/AcrR family transcriptional regulator [Paenibacillus sp. WQ 127069]MCU6791943.1 TetR/AcrR family transcriptional regulator [Paenibacillus sp. WQ 127069]